MQWTGLKNNLGIRVYVNHLVYTFNFTHPHKILFSYPIQKLINTMKNVRSSNCSKRRIVTTEWLNVEHNIKSSLVVGVEYRVHRVAEKT